MKTLLALVALIAGVTMCVHPSYGGDELMLGVLLAGAGVVYLFGSKLRIRS